MAKKEVQNESPSVDPEKLSRALQEFAERGQRITQKLIERQEKDGYQVADMGVISKAFMEMIQQMMANPVKLVETQAKLWADYAELWHATALRLGGEDAPAVVEPKKEDRRFADEAWNDQFVFDFINIDVFHLERLLDSNDRVREHG